MMAESWINGLAGGALIGLAASLLLLGNGKIAGISGILGGLFARPSSVFFERLTFVVGLLIAPLIYLNSIGEKEIIVPDAPVLLIVAGILVGFGTRLGSGCTSGHGVCGSARLSRRSILAMITFMTAAIVTAALMKLV